VVKRDKSVKEIIEKESGRGLKEIKDKKD